MLASGIPLPTVAVLFGLREQELQFSSGDEFAGAERSITTQESHP
jgi:tetrahydromethanopterin S-methyltransferase subunit E